MTRLLLQNRQDWGVPESLGTGELARIITQNTALRKLQMSPVNYPNLSPETRYVWGPGDLFEIATSLRTGSYISHGSAIYLNRLATDVPARIIVNKEQSEKQSSVSTLTQAGIDRAFSASTQRSSQLLYRLDGGTEVLIINGKNTRRLGVIQMDIGAGYVVDVTGLERTLIDIAVRPNYAGGVAAVLQAYQAAHGKMSVRKLIETLKQVDYLYPYHQVIGYYMQQAGFSPEEYNQLKDLGLDFDFYITYGMKQAEYRPEWRLHIPRCVSAPGPRIIPGGG